MHNRGDHQMAKIIDVGPLISFLKQFFTHRFLRFLTISTVLLISLNDWDVFNAFLKEKGTNIQ